MRSISNYTGQGNIILRNRQLNFNNLVAVITDSRIQEDTLTLIYYSEETQAAAKAAGISVQSSTGNLTFTAASTPSMTIICDIVLLSANIVNQVANASDIDYNNTTSGLTATDVQGAVDEVAVGAIKVYNGSYTTESIAPDTTKTVTVTLPPSYNTILAVIPYSCSPNSSWESYPMVRTVTHATGSIQFRIVGSGNAQTYTIRYSVLYR